MHTKIITFLIILTGICCDKTPAAEPAKKTKSIIEPIEHARAYLQGKRYAERKLEQETLRRALAQLKYFDGDGQLRFQQGGWNGSVFWFSPQVIMTNQHVAIAGTKDNLEYITFPHVVFFKRDLEGNVKSYVQTRIKQAHMDIENGKKILSDRIANLQQLSKRTSREEKILQSYMADLELLKHHIEPRMADKVFIPIDQAIDRFWFHNNANNPDIALIILKKPIDELLKEHGSNLSLDKEYFAENTIYDPDKHGWIYAGTPVYIAGYGRGSEDSKTDKRKSLTVFRAWIDNAGIHNVDLGNQTFPFEREFYYFEPSAASGDSGARMWAYLDEAGKISPQPVPLNRKKISIGINNSSGPGGDLLSARIMAPLFDELKKYSDTLKKPPGNVFPVVEDKKSSTLDYLLKFKSPVAEDLREAILSYITYKIILAHRAHDAEEWLLWHGISDKLSKPGSDWDVSEIAYLIDQAASEIFASPERPSPSELGAHEWTNYILGSKNLPDKEKQYFKAMVDNTIFNKFKDNYEVHLQHVAVPVKLKNYIKALDAWVNAKKYRRTDNYSSDSGVVAVPDPSKFFADIEELVAGF